MGGGKKKKKSSVMPFRLASISHDATVEVSSPKVDVLGGSWSPQLLM